MITFPTEEIIFKGVKLLAPVGTAQAMEDPEVWEKHTNGCGAGNAEIDYVPDTMWGLIVTPV